MNLTVAAVEFCLTSVAAGTIGFIISAKMSRNTLEAVRTDSNTKIADEQQAAKKNADRWQALLMAAQDPVLLVASDGRCEIANKSAEELFPGASGSLLLKLSQSSELSSFVRATSSNPTDGVASIEEFLLHHPSERTVQAVAFPAGDGYTIVILRDLTELRRLEMVRRDFVANVSHELRTPLSSVKAMAETLIDGAIADSEVAIHFLETIVHESDRLVRISADLLDLSRIESQPAEKKLQDISQIILNVTAGYGAQIKAAGHQMIIDIEQPLPLEIDPDEISQVMVNLVDNAIKYTPNSGVLTIRSEKDDNFVTISVSDTGIGILQQDLSRLFERFYRTDKARSRASGGTGLGLSIVKHIVERHGGSVNVVSEYNRGSTFSFTLPR
jgi:two-component system phosphate regulon sensor histidine kinase PhoR